MHEAHKINQARQSVAVRPDQVELFFFFKCFFDIFSEMEHLTSLQRGLSASMLAHIYNHLSVSHSSSLSKDHKFHRCYGEHKSTV